MCLIIIFYYNLFIIIFLHSITMAFLLVSISDDTINIYYILLAILPVMLLLILVVSGVFCFRVMSRRCVMQCKHFHQFIVWLYFVCAPCHIIYLVTVSLKEKRTEWNLCRARTVGASSSSKKSKWSWTHQQIPPAWSSPGVHELWN